MFHAIVEITFSKVRHTYCIVLERLLIIILYSIVLVVAMLSDIRSATYASLWVSSVHLFKDSDSPGMHIFQFDVLFLTEIYLQKYTQ